MPPSSYERHQPLDDSITALDRLSTVSCSYKDPPGKGRSSG
jgi:hypothetical protein